MCREGVLGFLHINFGGMKHSVHGTCVYSSAVLSQGFLARVHVSFSDGLAFEMVEQDFKCVFFWLTSQST